MKKHSVLISALITVMLIVGFTFAVFSVGAETVPASLNDVLEKGIVSDGCVRGIDFGTKVSDIIGESENAKVFKSDGITGLSADDIVGNGCIIRLYDENGNILEGATVIIKGDVNGDGKMDAYDYVAIRLAILQIETFECDHAIVIDEAVEATCEHTGLTEGSHCAICGEVITAQQTIKAKGHTVVTDKAVSATCTTDGLTEGSHCSVCGDVFVKQETVKATGHNMVDGECAKCHIIESKGLTYSLNENKNGYIVTGIGTCTDTEIIIPEKYNILPVTEIGSWAFNSYIGLTSITIPDSVTSIGDCAFYGCTQLARVSIPNNITSVGSSAFSGCIGLSDSDGFVIINDILYAYCGEDTSVVIPNNVIEIGAGAFSDRSGLTSITIPDNVTSIGEYAFYHVANVVYNGTAIGSPWGARSINGYIENGLVYKDSTKTELLACPSSTIGEVTIPNSVTNIGEYAFSYCTELTNITIPDSVTSIGKYAFQGCSLTFSVVIPNSVTNIGEGAFYCVKNIIYNGCASGAPWGAMAVNGYVENNIIYKDNSKKELISCFASSAGDIYIPYGVCIIHDCAFFNCRDITSIIIPSSVYSIGNSCFSGCSKIADLIIPRNVTEVGYCIASGCTNLTDIYCEATSQPSGWSSSWHYGCSATVHWGYTGE